MAFGPGKYDDVATRVREDVGLVDGDAGGVIVIVIGGHLGAGFSCQADLETTLALPDMLESIARQIRAEQIRDGLT
jgi:hypothetical protein